MLYNFYFTPPSRCKEMLRNIYYSAMQNIPMAPGGAGEEQCSLNLETFLKIFLDIQNQLNDFKQPMTKN